MKRVLSIFLTLMLLMSVLPLTVSAAAGDIASGGDNETILYDLWIGDTQVTSDNMNDILNDGGKARFDPVMKKLYLNDPTITGSHQYDDGSITILDATAIQRWLADLSSNPQIGSIF